MKILLIQPPVEDFYQTSLRTLPVGLLYLAASLRSAGIDVEVLDCQATMHKHVLEVPPEFAYLKRYYQPGNLSPFKLFSHYRHYGLPWEEIRERIRQAHADVIGISALFTPFYREALTCCGSGQGCRPDAPGDHGRCACQCLPSTGAGRSACRFCGARRRRAHVTRAGERLGRQSGCGHQQHLWGRL